MHFFFTSSEPHVLMKGILGGGATKKEYPCLNDSVEAQSWTHRSQESWGLWIMNVSVVVLSSQKQRPRLPSHHHHRCEQVEFEEMHCFELPKKKTLHLLTDSPSSLSEANPRATFPLCSAVHQPKPKVLACGSPPPTATLSPQAFHESTRARSPRRPVCFDMVPTCPRQKMWCSVALMFCYASLILKITMALVEPWVVLIWVACFLLLLFFLLPFPVSPRLSLFWEPTRCKPQVLPRAAAPPAAG